MKRNLLIIFLNLLLAYQAKAQWVVSPGSSGGSNNVNRIHAINTNTIWALDEGKQVYRTINGGSTWNRFYLSSKFPGSAIYAFTAIDENVAWVTTLNLSTTPFQAKLHKTTDGGITWTHQPSAYTSNFEVVPSIVHFFDANNGVTIGDAFGAFFEIYTTSNGGTNWNKVPATNLPPPSLQNDFTLSINKHTAIGNTIWYAAGGMRVFKSTDKGLTWTAANNGIPATSSANIVTNIAFSDANNGIVNYIDSFARTTDGGSTWAPFTPTGLFHTGLITKIPGVPGAYVSANSVYPSTTDPKGSSFSTDFGTTWVVLDANYYHKAIGFSSPYQGWSGDFGFLRKYTGTLLRQDDNALAVNNNFLITPNPGSGIFTVLNKPMKEFTLEVFNMWGARILQQKSKLFGNARLDLTSHPKGMYIVKIFSHGQITNYKIILQ